MTPRLGDAALDAALAFLLAGRDGDGLWRDYQLAPGASWAWSTGWIGWAVTQMVDRDQAADLLRPTVEALDGIRQPRGWSYNPRIAADADSTAWVLRLLAALHDPRARELSALLLPFITEEGGVRTFLGPQRFGSWAREHGDVTPMAGLALAECGGDGAAIERLRRWVLEHRVRGRGWRSFWWDTDRYATAWSLAFLDSSGGIPEPVRATVAGWARRQAPPSNALELALELNAMLSAAMPGAAACARALLARQQPDGSWPPSAALLVPEQRRVGFQLSRPNADPRGLMTTALAAQALCRWRRIDATPASGRIAVPICADIGFGRQIH
jgi:hypothetical protein